MLYILQLFFHKQNKGPVILKVMKNKSRQSLSLEWKDVSWDNG